MRIKSFEDIYKLNEAGMPKCMRHPPNPDAVKNDGVKLARGVKAYCRRNKDERPGHGFDLVFEGPGGKRVINNWAYYTGGYDQGHGVSQKQQWYLQTETGYGAGNGSGVSSRTKTPSLRYYRYMEQHLEKEFKHILDEIGN